MFLSLVCVAGDISRYSGNGSTAFHRTSSPRSYIYLVYVTLSANMSASIYNSVASIRNTCSLSRKDKCARKIKKHVTTSDEK